MKPIIIAIIGASGSGKTYLTKYLKNELNVPTVVSYTTRPVRQGEIEGEDHYFITKAQLPAKEEMLAYTRFGGYEYFALHIQVPASGLCSYVIDEEGLEVLTRKYSDRYTVIAIAVKCSPETLLQRGIAPERIQRDRDRRTLTENYFDAIIFNNGTLQEFEESIIRELKKL